MGATAVAHALGRIEANQEASKSRQEDMARTIQQVRDNVHTLRDDLQSFVNEQKDHERRLTDFGERLKSVEDDAEKVAAYIAAQEGVRGFVKWAITAGCGAVGAIAAFLGIWWTRG